MRIVRPGGSVTLPNEKHAEAVYEALLQFDWGDPSKWTGGKPNIQEVAKLVGEKVTERVVNAVWKALVGKVEEVLSRQQANSHVRVTVRGGAK